MSGMAVSLVLVAVVDVVIRRGLPRRGAVSLMPGELAGRVVAPYVTSWSEESVWDVPVVLGEQGIAYADEHVMDRDQDGVLWARCPVRRGWGRPVFGEVHPLRQRRAMRRLLCQVCAGPADRTKDGVLWLLVDWRHDWPDWPNRMGVIEPPICVPCARLSVRVCPTLRRRGAVAVRARRYPVAGAFGALYQPQGHAAVFTGPGEACFEDPTIRWIRATRLIRQVDACILIEVDDLPDGR